MTTTDDIIKRIQDDIRSGEVGPNILCRELDRAAAALRERDKRIAELTSERDEWRVGCQAEVANRLRVHAITRWCTVCEDWVTRSSRKSRKFPAREAGFVDFDGTPGGTSCLERFATLVAAEARAAAEADAVKLRTLVQELGENLPYYYDSANGLHIRIRAALAATEKPL